MRRILLKLLRRRRLQRDLDAELAFHREMSRGNRDAIPFGNAAVIKEQAFDLWRFSFVENLWRDLLYAGRGLRRSPALVASALLSLGLGIGINTAIFSLAVELLLSEPSVRDAGSLVYVRVGGGSHASAKVREFVRSSGLFRAVAGVNEEGIANFNDGAETHRIFAVYTTKNYFTELGIPMLYGRGIEPGDPDEVAVLHYGFWRRYFNGDPSVIRRAINMDGRQCTIVGILPEHHHTLLGFGYSPDVSMPRHRDDIVLAIYARLKPGMTRAEALAGVLTVARRMDAAMPISHSYTGNCSVAPIAGLARLTAQKETLTVGIFFAMLLAIVGLVLLIACINVVSLLLARAAGRRRETATRLALGAARGRILQQFLSESLLLSLAGAALGFLLAELAAILLARVRLPLPLPILLDVEPDWRVAIYGALLTTFAAVLCGLLPAWRSVKESLAPDLHREGKMRLRRMLVVAQVATSVIVLTTGFLFLRNLVNAGAISPGFDVHHTLRADVNLPPATFTVPERTTAYIQRVLRELAILPGIETVAAARIVPFTDNIHYGTQFRFPDNNQKVRAHFWWNAVTPEYFRAMDIPIRQGRTFSAADRGGKAVVVNRTFVERFLGGRQPVGTVFIWDADEKAPFRIVGVVEGTKTFTIGEEQQPQLYEQVDRIPADRLHFQFVLRSAIPPALQLDPVRRALHRIEPMAGAQVETMFSSIGLAFLPSQVGAVLLGSVGILGLLLATIGLYGVMVYSVSRRTREIGVRVAVGATARDISRMVLRDSARLTLAGSCTGLLLAAFVTRPLAMFLVPGLTPTDPLNFAVVLLVMILTGLAASWGPVRRALAVDPNVALRDE
jgi:putative ABC transport system permease protein